MAFLRLRNKVITIYYYNPVTGKRTSKSTGMNPSEKNFSIARKMARDIEFTLQKKRREIRLLGGRKFLIGNVIEHYLRLKQNLSKNGKRSLNRFFKLFCSYFPKEMACSLISRENVEDFILGFNCKSFSNNTKRLLIVYLKSFLKFLFEYEYTVEIRINKSLIPKREFKPKIIFDENEINFIFESLPKNNPYLLLGVHFLFYTGLRPIDIYNLRIENIDESQMMMRILSTKTNLLMEIPLHPDLLSIIQLMKKEKTNGRILGYATSESFNRAVNIYLRYLGITDYKAATAYSFRKTFVSRARYCGIDATVIKELIGHSHSNTLDLYYSHLSIEYLRNELAKYKGTVNVYKTLNVKQSEEAVSIKSNSQTLLSDTNLGSQYDGNLNFVN
ncbi:MAG: tyrosine-type recombinase/integrase [Parachlamydiaceae bacterium]|nr:tyrosine-type recombinase/integrase [Parachlamydiaceae bacterium]